MKYFWTHRDNIPEGLGYGQFSAAHFILMALTVLFTVIITIAYHGSDANGRIIILRSIAATLMIIEVIKMILIWFSDVKFTDYLPLEICSFAAYSCVFDSINPQNEFFSILLLTLFLPAATMAIIVPTTSTLPAFNFYTIHQFLYHGLIIAYVIARFACGEMALSYPQLWLSVGKILILVGIMYCVDTIFDKNFMFLRDTYGNALLGVIWNKTGGGFRYTIGLVLFSIVVIHVFYLLFWIINMLFIAG